MLDFTEVVFPVETISFPADCADVRKKYMYATFSYT